MMKYWLIKTRFGWSGVATESRLFRGGITANKDVIKQVVLPGPDKQLVLKRLGIKYTDLTDTTDTKLTKILRDYFGGKRVVFRCQIDLSRFTGFERRVYEQLRRIPYGRTITYSELARRAGVPNGARAVGNVMAKNPLPIIIPCHRVIRKNGAIGNFSAIGGPRLKTQLLKMEGAR